MVRVVRVKEKSKTKIKYAPYFLRPFTILWRHELISTPITKQSSQTGQSVISVDREKSMDKQGEVSS